MLAGAAAPALAQNDQGVRGEVGKTSKFAKLVPAEQVEQAAAAQYNQMRQEAAQQRGLARDKHAQVVRVLVSDRGPGIPADALEKVLRPFVRLETSRNRHTGGVPAEQVQRTEDLVEIVHYLDAMRARI